MMASEMIVAVGLEAIGQGVGAEDRAVWQVQVGVTRVGAGGRILPRCRNGRMATAHNLVASIVAPQELVRLPNPARKSAPLARAIVLLTVAVVVRALACRASSVLAAVARIARAIWHAVVPPRRAVSTAARQAWRSAREMGIDLPSIYATTSA